MSKRRREAYIGSGEGWFDLTGAGVVKAVRHAGGAASDATDRASRDLVEGAAGDRLAQPLGHMDDKDLVDTLVDLAWVAGQDGTVSAAERVFITRVCEKVGLPRRAAAELCDVALPDESGTPPVEPLERWRTSAVQLLWGRRPQDAAEAGAARQGIPAWAVFSPGRGPRILTADALVGRMQDGSAIGIVRPGLAPVLMATLFALSLGVVFGFFGIVGALENPADLLEGVSLTAVWAWSWALASAFAMYVTAGWNKKTVQWYGRADAALRLACHGMTKGAGRGDKVLLRSDKRWIRLWPAEEKPAWMLAISADRDKPSFLRLTGQRSLSAARALRQQGILAEPDPADPSSLVARLPAPREAKEFAQALDTFFGRLNPKHLSATRLELVASNTNPPEPLTRRAVARASASGWKPTPPPTDPLRGARPYFALVMLLGVFVYGSASMMTVSDVTGAGAVWWDDPANLVASVGPFVLAVIAGTGVAAIFGLYLMFGARPAGRRGGLARGRSLVVEDGRLTWLGEREPPIELSKPFRLSITVDPALNDDEPGIAGFELIQSGGGNTARMRFRVAAERGPKCPRLQQYALKGPLVDAAALADKIWPAIRYWSAMHGRPALIDLRHQLRRLDEVAPGAEASDTNDAAASETPQGVPRVVGGTVEADANTSDAQVLAQLDDWLGDG